jgi:SsrA-binding protein
MRIRRNNRLSLSCILLLSLCLKGSEAFTLFPSKHRVDAASRPSIRPSLQLLARSGKKKKKANDNTIAVNRLAYRNYELLETLEVGISLLGTEVKAIRAKGSVNLRDGYVKCNKFGQTTMHNVHIAKCQQAGQYFQHEERRVRTLLLHKQEARKLAQKTENLPGMTLVPIKAYFNDGNKVKLQIALCRGKNVRDKRTTIQARDAKREENRIIKTFRVPM